MGALSGRHNSGSAPSREGSLHSTSRRQDEGGGNCNGLRRIGWAGRLASPGQRLGLLRHDLAVLPYIDRRAVGSRCPARRSRCASEGTSDRRGKALRLVLLHVSVYGPRSKSSGTTPELSYTAHSSASVLYAM